MWISVQVILTEKRRRGGERRGREEGREGRTSVSVPCHVSGVCVVYCMGFVAVVCGRGSGPDTGAGFSTRGWDGLGGEREREREGCVCVHYFVSLSPSDKDNRVQRSLTVRSHPLGNRLACLPLASTGAETSRVAAVFFLCPSSSWQGRGGEGSWKGQKAEQRHHSQQSGEDMEQQHKGWGFSDHVERRSRRNGGTCIRVVVLRGH